MTAIDTKLHDFEDNPVVNSKIEIPDAAGGLREAMKIDPVELHHGDEGHVVLHYRVKKVRFDPAGKGFDEGDLTRVHVFETLEAAFIDDDKVAEHVRDNALRVKREIERLGGTLHLDDDLEQEELDAQKLEELVSAHDEGLHAAGLVDGCPACDERAEDRKRDARD